MSWILSSERLRIVIFCIGLIQLSPVRSSAQIFDWFTDIDHYEIITGPNLYFISYDETETDQVYEKLGFFGAINLHHNFKPRIGLTTRLFYDHHGFISKFTTNYFDNSSGVMKIGEVKAETFSNYIGLALLTQIKLTQSHNFFVEAGPYANYILNARSVRTFLWNGTTSTSYFDDDNRFSGGICFSIGYYFPMKKSHYLSIRLSDNFNIISYSAHTLSFLLGFNFN